ncbi:armadillo repeat-containing protein 1-like [Elysia marginata]|uniref:Armadillo repeat-containing protein 1 n=1 Tax=Elysia marginata TaxID=1093978 RepID=A0AAV4IQX1_9GAST|nr:armadillo repeat-containing protein 1-like [Elysia marginata]
MEISMAGGQFRLEFELVSAAPSVQFQDKMVTTDAIAAMKAMASDPKKRVALAKDTTCIGGLVIVLSNPDAAVVKEALQTFLLLCECSESRRVLKDHVGMMDQLEKLAQRPENKDDLSQLAASLKAKLMLSSEAPKAPLRDCSNISSRRNSTAKNQSLQGHKVKTVVLLLRGYQDKSDRDLCARLLLKVTGVISITFDLSKLRCIVRTKPDVKAEALARSIARSMTMTAQQVVRNENGEESFIAFGPNSSIDHNTSCGKENTDLPDYLSDDSDSIIVDDKALKRPTEEDKKKSAGWFSAAANFLTNSFYW